MPLPPDSKSFSFTLSAALAALLAIAFLRYFESLSAMLAVQAHDDSFYYLLPAFHFSRFGEFSFDGVNPAYGFQPLYALVLSVFAWCSDSLETLLRWSFAINALLFAACVYLLFASVRESLCDSPEWLKHAAGLFGALLFALNAPVFMAFTAGKENALACTLLALTYWLVLKFSRRETVFSKKSAAIGLCVGFLLLSRLLPASLLAAGVCVGVLIRKRAPLAPFFIGAAAPWALWGLYAYTKFGRLLPVSGSVKLEPFAISSLWLPFDYIYQALRFALGFSSSFHYVIQPNGWLVDNAPAHINAHTAFAAVALLCLLASAAGIIIRRRIHLSMEVSMFFASLVGLFAIPFFVGSGQLYYFVWYVFSLPYTLSLVSAIAFGKCLASIAAKLPDWNAIKPLMHKTSPALGFIAGLTLIVSTYRPMVPLNLLQLNNKLWSNLIVSASSYVELHLDISKFSRIGSLNAGALGFFLPQQVINLDALANDDAYAHYSAGGSYASYIRENAIDLCMDVGIEDILLNEGISHTLLRSFELHNGSVFSIIQIDPVELNYPEGYRIRHAESVYRGRQAIGLFESENEDWTFEGVAMANQPIRMELGLNPVVTGYMGNRLVHSGIDERDRGLTGTAVSAPFQAGENSLLIFSIGGGDSPDVGMELLCDDETAQRWHGDGSTHLREVIVDLSPYFNKELQLRVFDRSEEPGKFVLFDNAMLLKRER